ncbi:MAG: selenium metabolism-associated LysR family transcriptional regulator [Pseudomonadota bacterium]
MFDLRQLEVFCQVMELRSFSKAAESVFLTQPTVSGHIQALEQYLRTRLFDRLGKTIVPTKAGEILYTYAKQILKLRADAQRELELFLGRVKGELVIGASTIPGTYILPGFIGLFKKTNPDIYVHLVLSDTMGIVEKILTGTIEAGVIGAGLDNDKLSFRPFVRDEMLVIVPAGHRWAARDSIEVEELKREPFILREPGSGTRMSSLGFLGRSGTEAENLNVAAEIGSTEAIRQAIKAGLGISILSRRAVEDDLKAGILNGLRVKGIDLWRQFYVAVLRNRTLSPATESFIDILIS